MTDSLPAGPGAPAGARTQAATEGTGISAVRADFPVLQQRIGNEPLIYLDWGATAQRPRSVLEAERAFLERDNGAVHRGAHELAARSTSAFEQARETIARFAGAQADEIAWTLSATDAINLIALGLDRASHGFGGEQAARLALREGDEIVLPEAEHHANLVPWQQLARSTGAVIRPVPVNERGVWTIDDAAAVVGPRTRVLAFAHVSNVTGMIAPVAELCELGHRHGALVVLDACQSAPNRPLDLHGLGVDAAAFSGHKMLGPNGIGVLYGRRELLAALPPARTGGSMITTVTMEESEFMEPPMRFEAGTQPVSQAIALAQAARYLDAIGMSRIEEHEAALGQRLVEGLTALPGIRVLGPAAGEPRAGLAAFDVAGVHAHDVTQFLDARGIAVRGGHHCAQPLHRRLGLTASTRASTHAATTAEEIDRFLATVAEVRPWFGAGA